MPYRSKAQRAYMHIHHPEIAKRWDAEYGGRIVKKKGSTMRSTPESSMGKKKKVVKKAVASRATTGNTASRTKRGAAKYAKTSGRGRSQRY